VWDLVPGHVAALLVEKRMDLARRPVRETNAMGIVEIQRLDQGDPVT
jgi:hypothetical protein